MQVGSTLGVAIVGTVVNNTVASDIVHRLPAGAQVLTPAGIAAATSPQALVNPVYRDMLLARAKQAAAHNAVATAQAQGKIPSGPSHDAVVASITQQAEAGAVHLINQIFSALKDSLLIWHPAWIYGAVRHLSGDGGRRILPQGCAAVKALPRGGSRSGVGSRRCGIRGGERGDISGVIPVWGADLTPAPLLEREAERRQMATPVA